MGCHEALDEHARVFRQLFERDAHARRIGFVPHDFAGALDGLDAVHENGEVNAHLGANRQHRGGFDEHARAADVRDVFLDELVDGLELFVDRESVVAALVVVHGLRFSRVRAALLADEIELLVVVLLARHDVDFPHEAVLRLLERAAVHGGEHVGDGGVRVDDDRVAREVFATTADLAKDLVRDGFLRLQVARAVAVETGLVQDATEALARALARHLDEAEIADAVQRGLGLVLLKELFELAANLLARRRRIHVDEVEDDESADVAEAQLVGDFEDGLEVRLEDRLLHVL